MWQTTVFRAVVGGIGMSEYGRGNRINAGWIWSGGLATALVAGLVILVGTLVARGVLEIPVLAPEEAGYFGDASTGAYAAMAAIAALLATAVLHLLLVSAPRPRAFFGWIVGLGTVVAAVAPFSQDAGWASQAATGAINAATGIAILSLLGSVAATATAAGARTRGYPGAGAGPAGGYASGYRDAMQHRTGTQDTRRSDTEEDTTAQTRIERE
ncbi:hypothetical protein FHX37_4576 [Haloactinospora alba]|uniref:Uncharacterized protein n=2 Tax=Haloactinospora alba TaxID=405555 RepID=A0A543N7N7_9ACTN|nr:hypothetical protein FHX37_4576 [Haloactinospora alba]